MKTSDQTSDNSSNLKDERKKNKFKKKKIKFKNTNSIANIHNSSRIHEKKEKAISYLEKWKNDKNNWKFEKLTQYWLLKNMFDNDKVPEKSFEVLLQYLVNLKGGSKQLAIELCENVIKNMEKKLSTDEENKVSECSYHRARSVLQHL